MRPVQRETPKQAVKAEVGAMFLAIPVFGLPVMLWRWLGLWSLAIFIPALLIAVLVTLGWIAEQRAKQAKQRRPARNTSRP